MRAKSPDALPPLRAFTGGVLDLSRRDARLQCRWGVTSARDPHPHPVSFTGIAALHRARLTSPSSNCASPLHRRKEH